MSLTTPNAASTVNSQNESKLFDLPLEIRQLIYSHFINKHGYHVVSSTEGELALTPCLGARPYNGDVGRERVVVEGPTSSDQMRYERRLRSSWARHWMCEEFWMGGAVPIMRWKDPSEPGKFGKEELGMDLSSIFPALRLCRRMYAEVMEWVAAEAEFHVVDVETLLLLGDMSPSQGQVLANDSQFGFRRFTVNRVQKISLSLSRPLAFFQTHERSSLIGNVYSSSKLEGTPSAHTSPPISLHAGLPRLRRLTLWLDHTGTQYWSVVNERALLTPILQDIAAYDSLNFVAILPKTHPTLADEERHFLNDTIDIEAEGASPSFVSATVHRVYRQRLRDVRGSEDHAGYLEYVYDFPHLLDHSFCNGKSMAEVEEIEAANWNRGVDTVKELGPSNTGRSFGSWRRRR